MTIVGEFFIDEIIFCHWDLGMKKIIKKIIPTPRNLLIKIT